MKTLADPGAAKLLKVWKTATVGELGNKAHPPHVPNNLPRQHGYGEVEFTIFRVDAELVGWKISPDDSDIHLVIGDLATSETMIAEFPLAACIPSKASASHRKKMVAARKALKKACSSVRLSSTYRLLSGRARLVGVGFFDKDHGQKSPAKNRIELHPVLSFTRASCSAGP